MLTLHVKTFQEADLLRLARSGLKMQRGMADGIVWQPGQAFKQVEHCVDFST